MISPAPAATAAGVFATKKSAVLFLRWVVILTASYLVLFGEGSQLGDPHTALFVAIFLASNLLVSFVPADLFDRDGWRGALVLFDTVWISYGMYLAGENSSELFLLYFSVLFLAALGESEAMIAGGCLLIGLLYLFFLLRTQTPAELLKPSMLLRFPFLVGIATFYGHLVTIAKGERRAAEIARVRERARTDLLATLTHDLRTPLAAITSFAELLLDDDDALDAAERRQILGDIKKLAMEGIDLVGSFLAMASTEAASAMPRERVDLNAIVRDVVRRYRGLVVDKDIRLQEQLADALPLVAGDRVQLARAIANLLANAIKFVHRGGRIEVGSASDGRTVSLSVRDDGPGIPEGLRDRLFQPYVSEDDRQPGTGLGLFIVRLVAETHGGSIHLSTGVERGAGFVLQLPAVADAR